MAEEEFEIDIYGDAPQDNQDGNAESYDGQTNGHSDEQKQDQQHDYHEQHHNQEQHDAPAPQQGVKRKGDDGHGDERHGDDRQVDPGATTAIMISDLNWWNTDDDIRGWCRQAQCEDELKDITFSEHKVNGKSKGQVYVEFTSQQAATAAKHAIEATDGSQGIPKKHQVTYSNPTVNPFRTLPKDAPNRAGKEQGSRPGGSYNNQGAPMGEGGYRGGYRGRGGFNGPRGGGMNQNFNRNFSGGMGGGFNNNMSGGGGGFNNGMGGGSFGGGFQRGGGFGGGMRGGPGMRGGRGGMNNPMGGMGMGPMGGMPMGGMPNMGMMGGGMPGFHGMPQQFNHAFFGGNQGGGNDWGNPHGAKRPRPE
ncbi:hypothetical protein C8035_v001508 [Colletotrichum spinosum]|uniref:RRM domain-containing protein n=1 Tax=Colletotrichum spinosum TaxID=1347390 RepID=A0A4R8QCI8_9PEZI|nr:hypothetical protein C8035_v001508 [Colletotrichum spinosum]